MEGGKIDKNPRERETVIGCFPQAPRLGLGIKPLQGRTLTTVHGPEFVCF